MDVRDLAPRQAPPGRGGDTRFRTYRTNIERDPPDGKRLLDLKHPASAGGGQPSGGLNPVQQPGLTGRPHPRRVATRGEPPSHQDPTAAGAARRLVTLWLAMIKAASGSATPTILHRRQRLPMVRLFTDRLLASAGLPRRGPTRDRGALAVGEAFPCFGRLNRLVS